MRLRPIASLIALIRSAFDCPPIARAYYQDLTFGVLLGLAIPIVGGLYGVWMLLKGNGNGGWVILFSCFAAVLWVFVLAFLLGFSDGLSGGN